MRPNKKTTRFFKKSIEFIFEDFKNEKFNLDSTSYPSPNISYPSTATCGKADGYCVKLEFGLERYVLIQPSVKIQVVPCPISLRTASRHEVYEISGLGDRQF